jgi:hypothetical protein
MSCAMADTGRLGPSKTKRDRKARSMGFLYKWRYVSVAQVYVKDSCLHQVFVQ